MLAIVPARSGSKGLPKKNLRIVDGKPLVLLLLDKLRTINSITRIVCTTDDPTIEALCRMHGYQTLGRPDDLAADDATVHDVAAWVVRQLDWEGMVGVFQPTSPTLRAETIELAIGEFIEHPEWDSLASVTPWKHMMHDVDGRPLGDYVNRQYARPLWMPTGGVQLARTVPAEGGSTPMVGRVHHLYEVPAAESVDIDSASDLYTARAVLTRREIAFNVVASDALGTGHLRRCISIAQELPQHHVRFSFADEVCDWAVAEVMAAGYDIGPEGTYPDIVVFDKLDTTMEEVASMRAGGCAVLCLEDLGPGSNLADFVVNELYDDRRPNSVCGPTYAVLRPEFQALPPFEIDPRKQPRVLVTFGGTDPTDMVHRVADVIFNEANIVLMKPAMVMAEQMMKADLLITSCGRTVHEAAAVGIPTIAIAVNERESRHSFCPGPIYLGPAVTLMDEQIRETVKRVLNDIELRHEMSTTARAAVDGKGAQRIAHFINGLLEGL